VLALVSFLVLTLVLGVDFNLERLYRAERGEVREAMPRADGLAGLLARVYGVAYAPQDRLVEAYVRRRLRDRPRDARLAWHDGFTVGVLANFGLSPQLAALGLCLALGRPATYVYAVCGCALVLAPLAALRELLARRAVRGLEPLVVLD
jgi:hypothetical protein